MENMYFNDMEEVDVDDLLDKGTDLVIQWLLESTETEYDSLDDFY